MDSKKNTNEQLKKKKAYTADVNGDFNKCTRNLKE
jgi:hypothetical protein